MFITEKQYPGFYCNWLKRSLRLVALVIFGLAGPGAVFADEVTDWNQHTINLIQTARASSIATMRILAVSSS